jgi:toxin ParE1/3/4
MVIWSEPARDDLLEIYDFISRDSHFYAEQVIFTIIEQVDKLEQFPRIGKMVEELLDENIRDLIVESYHVVYEIVNNDIHILAVIHTKRNFENALKDHIE